MGFSITLSALLLLAPQVAHGFAGISSIPSAFRSSSSSSSLRHTTPLLMSASSSSTTSNGFFELPEDGMAGGSRTDTEDAVSSQYLQGDQLHRLRQHVLSLRQALHEARQLSGGGNDNNRVQQLSRAILDAQQRDAEFMYQVSLERMEAASQAGLTKEAATYQKEAEAARKALPQFQLEGLWVGKYGDSFQMVNVSYVGDILVAHKVTGDRHVPKGEITFQADLSPVAKDCLDPIELTDDAAVQWGSRYLQRHAGLGQVASSGYSDAQWLDGQLILVNQYFSFAWLPTGHQVFFGRPSPELTLKLLRECSTWSVEHPSTTGSADPATSPRQYLARCMEETELLNDEMEVSDGVFQSHDQSSYYDQAGCFE